MCYASNCLVKQPVAFVKLIRYRAPRKLVDDYRYVLIAGFCIGYQILDREKSGLKSTSDAGIKSRKKKVI